MPVDEQCPHSAYYLLNKYSCLLTDLFAKLNCEWQPNSLFVHKLKANVLFMGSD